MQYTLTTHHSWFLLSESLTASLVISTKKSTQGDRTDYRASEKLVTHYSLHDHTISQFHLPERKSCQLGPRKLKKKRKQKLAQLQNTVACGESVKTTTKYQVLLPTEEAHHSFHETKEAAGYAQRIHPKLVEKILRTCI